MLAIGKTDVQWRAADGTERHVAADSVVLAFGAEADTTVADRLAGCGVPVTCMGDCAGVNYIEGAMHEGHRAGREA